MAPPQPEVARVRRRRRVQFPVALDHHPRRRLLYSRRLEQDDLRARQLAAARPSRQFTNDRPRDQRRLGGFHPGPVAGVSLLGPVVRPRVDLDRPRFRLPDRRVGRPFELRPVCRVADRPFAFARRRPRSGLAKSHALLLGPRRCRGRPIPRRQCALAEARWRIRLGFTRFG